MGRWVIEWFGHSYVRITSPQGTRIVIDPHDGASLNLPEYRVRGDILVVTHNHYDHNAREMVAAGRTLIAPRGTVEVGDVKITGLHSYHDKAQGQLRGDNTIVKIEGPDGEVIAHMGDIGHLPDDRLYEELSGVSVLMLPVGGVYTINAYEAWEIVEKLRPRLVVPLHFWVPYSTTPLDPLDTFLDYSKAGRLRLEENRITITLPSGDQRTVIAVFPDPHTLGGVEEW